MTARLNSLTGLLAVILVAGCGAPFEAGGSGAGGNDAGGAASSMAAANKGGRAGAGGSDTAMSPGGAAGASESAGSAGATGHENACTKEMTFDHPTCMANDWPTYYGAGCTAPCRPTNDGYWCCPG